MSQMKSVLSRQSTIGDAAVDGLLGGLGGGFVMAIYLVAAGLAGGELPATVLSRFDPSAAAAPLTGALMHLAVAGVYGMVFGIGFRWIRIRSRSVWLLGLAYGAALFMLAEAIILPGTRSSLLAVPVWSFGLAHVIYGVTLGGLVGRVGANSK